MACILPNVYRLRHLAIARNERQEAIFMALLRCSMMHGEFAAFSGEVAIASHLFRSQFVLPMESVSPVPSCVRQKQDASIGRSVRAKATFSF